ncbi:MAG: hypothetical protein PVJ04_13510 [Gemmatimonadota bacterium]|jgi:hypothetical protein
MDPTPYSILFVTSSSRSGSTLLDILLGSLDGYFSTGEIRHIWYRGLLEDWPCGCGEPFSKCEFWPEVIRSAFGSLTRKDAERIVELQKQEERTHRLVFSSLRPERPLSPQSLEYQQRLLALYDATRKISGCRNIVDSSKLGSHGYVVSRMANDSGRVDFRSVHLIRDSRAVAYSWYKILKSRGGEPPSGSNLFRSVAFSRGWIGSNLTSHILARRVEGQTVMFYEDLARRPTEVLSRFLSEIGLVEAGSIVKAEAKPTSHHTVSGNQMRMSDKPLEIRPDMAWKKSLPRTLCWGVTLLTSPFLYRYGYLGGVSSDRSWAGSRSGVG